MVRQFDMPRTTLPGDLLRNAGLQEGVPWGPSDIQFRDGVPAPISERQARLNRIRSV